MGRSGDYNIESMTRPSLQLGIIIFTRFPEPGLTKTRLIPVLGPEGACRLHRELTERIVARVRRIKKSYPLMVEIHFAGGSREQMAGWLGPDFPYVLQAEGDLGARMRQAFQKGFRQGWEQVVLIGSDLPDLTPAILRESFDRLTNHDLVLGPARDGGYYLIGLKADCPELFGSSMIWGTREVLKNTLLTADRLGLETALLTRLRDVDRPEDLTEKIKLKYVSNY
jgi:rSAM/selenodomain-associated transferase 1